MRIAYIGPARGTSLHRARALERLGHEVHIIDPWVWLLDSKWVGRWIYHLGAAGIGLFVDNRIEAEVRKADPNLIFVDQGEFLGSALLERLRRRNVPITNYTIDDPFGGRDKKRFRRYLKALPYYDLVAVVRKPNITEARAHGARHVLRVWRSADDIAHKRRELTIIDCGRFVSDVAFIGTWMPERSPFLTELIDRGVPLSIWGDRWQKAKEWPKLQAHWRGPGLFDDASYAAVISSAKVCIGLLSKGNRDLHTTRSLEIPSLGGLLCAERTQEHLELYREGEEAVFWGNAEECTVLCKELLADEPRRREIARRGHERALKNGLYNEAVMAKILDEAQRVFQEGR